jgi:hypothetical protein
VQSGDDAETADRVVVLLGDVALMALEPVSGYLAMTSSSRSSRVALATTALRPRRRSQSRYGILGGRLALSPRGLSLPLRFDARNPEVVHLNESKGRSGQDVVTMTFPSPVWVLPRKEPLMERRVM